MRVLAQTEVMLMQVIAQNTATDKRNSANTDITALVLDLISKMANGISVFSDTITRKKDQRAGINDC